MASIALAGCFGPPTMQHDIEAYNQATVDSETDMLLYNIGQLSENQPPHFTMLSSVSQSRTFSAAGGFSWTQALAALNPVTMISHAATATGTTVATTSSNLGTGSTWTAGPFSAGSMESPTIAYVPIQGPDFAQRFETPLRDKLLLLLEDKWWFGTPADFELLVKLFAESLYLYHAEGDVSCKGGVYKIDRSALYVNRPRDSQDSRDKKQFLTPDYYYDDFSKCVDRIVNERLFNSVLIDGHNPVPTLSGAEPSPTEAVAALQANYEWDQQNGKYDLSTPVRIPAWLDYDPKFEAAKPSTPDSKVLASLSAPWWHSHSPPNWDTLLYHLPKNYQWKANSESNGGDDFAYVLVPDGYGIKKVGPKYVLVPDGYLPKKMPSYTPNDCKKNPQYVLVRSNRGFNLKPVNCNEMVASAYTLIGDSATKFGLAENKSVRLSYSDTIVQAVEPVPQDYVYIEFRQKEVDDDAANKACFKEPPNGDLSIGVPVICGYFKISNLFEIMKRLADMACEDIANPSDSCAFGIGYYNEIPTWADRYVRFGTNNQYIWEPAHSPVDKINYDRDRKLFAVLYKLYQLSLVDTSKLVTGAPPITIGK
jgi:hypothetical protein